MENQMNEKVELTEVKNIFGQNIKVGSLVFYVPGCNPTLKLGRIKRVTQTTERGYNNQLYVHQQFLIESVAKKIPFVYNPIGRSYHDTENAKLVPYTRLLGVGYGEFKMFFPVESMDLTTLPEKFEGTWGTSGFPCKETLEFLRSRVNV
jgi:hypothetical protein